MLSDSTCAGLNNAFHNFDIVGPNLFDRTYPWALIILDIHVVLELLLFFGAYYIPIWFFLPISNDSLFLSILHTTFDDLLKV